LFYDYGLFLVLEWCLYLSVARGSRGTRQLKDFMGDDRVSREHRSTRDELSDGHEAVASDHSDSESHIRRQPVGRGQRGRGRPANNARGRPMRFQPQYRNQEHGDDVADISQRPRYSSVRGRGKEPVADRPVYERTTNSYESREDWNQEIGTSRSSENVQQHRDNRFHAVADSRMSELQQSRGSPRVSDNVRSQRHEDKPTARRVHPTRTISNTHYQTADSIPNKDRRSQIGGIVDAMNKISVSMVAGDKSDVGMQQNVAQKSTVIVSGMYFVEKF